MIDRSGLIFRSKGNLTGAPLTCFTCKFYFGFQNTTPALFDAAVLDSRFWMWLIDVWALSCAGRMMNNFVSPYLVQCCFWLHFQAVMRFNVCLNCRNLHIKNTYALNYSIYYRAELLPLSLSPRTSKGFGAQGQLSCYTSSTWQGLCNMSTYMAIL